MGGEVFQDLHVDVYTHPSGDGNEQRVGGHDRRVGLELLNKLVRLGSVGAAEGSGANVGQGAHLIGTGSVHAEHLHIRTVDDGEYGAGHRHARGPIVTDFLPYGTVPAYLVSLDLAQSLSSGFGNQGGRHQVQPVLRSLLRRCVGARAVEDMPAQRGCHGEDWQGRAGLEHVGVLTLQRCGGGEPGAVDSSHEGLKMGARHVSAVGGLALVAEGLPAALSNLGGAAGDSQGHTSAGELIQGCGLLGEVERIFVAHVNHAGAHLDLLGGGGNRTKQWHRRGRLWHEVVDAEGGIVHADLVRSLGDLQVDLGDLLRRRPALAADGIMPEAQETESSHWIPLLLVMRQQRG